MSLPTGGAWPPPPHKIALAQQDIWSAWLVGDPEGLATAYGSAEGGVNPFGEHPSQRAGGIVGTVARAFWGRPSASGQRKARLHVPLAADIATASADLLFSEPPQFTIEGEPPAKKRPDGTTTLPSKAQQRVDELLNCGDFHATLMESAEIVAGLGGGWLRLVWDTDVADHVMIDAVPADSAIGEWRLGSLQAVTFFTEYADGQKVIRHLERHEPGAIYHGLYAGSPGKLGRPIALADHPCTAPYVTLVNEEGAILTDVRALTAAYTANMRPQRRWRKIEALKRLGRSDFDGVEPLMDALDETMTSWMRDVRLGKARILVPEFMLKNLGRGQGTMWDEDQEVYTALNVAPTEGATSQITPQQFIMRVAEHRQTADALIDQVLDAAGYSPSTFGRGSEGIATATEVVSRERKSARTRDKKTRYWSQALEPFLSTWLELDALVFKTGAKGEVEAKWADVSQPDTEALARTANSLRMAEAASTKTLVAMTHPDWDEAAIDAEVALVIAESGSPVPEPAF